MKASRARARPLVFGRALTHMLRSKWSRARRTPAAAPRRILVAHHLLLGDTIMLTPLLAKCRARWPDAEVVMTCPVAYTPLYSGRPYGVRALPYDPRRPATLRPIVEAGPYDLALVPADNRLSWLARAADARWIVAFAGDRPAYKDWPVDELRSYPDTPQAWGDLVAGLVDGPPPAPYRVADWPVPEADGVVTPSSPYCVLHAGASSALKQWLPDRWRDLAERLTARGYAVVLSAGPGETELLDAVDPDRTWPRHEGNLSLAQLWHLLARAAVVVCPDTGIGHLARVAGAPAVVLFGPGSALLSGAGEFWRHSAFTAVTIPDFPCRDQRITMKREVEWIRRCERFQGYKEGRCPIARCMVALTQDMVWEAVARRLRIVGT
jgi:ADP-heptose:LPS heptosyltransferase